jgi:hypothetical protein
MTRMRPEALVKNWVPTMQFTAGDFRPVERRRGWKEGFANVLSRWLPRER